MTKLLDTQQALARLGIFDRIDVTTFETDPETMSRSVLVTVSEGRPWSLTYAIGAEYNPQSGDASLNSQLSLRLSLAVTYANLFGRALEVGVEGRASNSDPRLIFTARDRSLFGGKVPLSFAVYKTQDVPSPAYDVKRSGTFLQGEYASRRRAHGSAPPVRARGAVLGPRPRRTSAGTRRATSRPSPAASRGTSATIP